MTIKIGHSLYRHALGIILFSLVIFNFQAMPQDKTYCLDLQKKGRLILIIIDYNDFFCPMCLEPINAFCDLIHLKGLEDITFEEMRKYKGFPELE